MLNCGRRFGKDILERNYAAEGLLSGEPVGWYEPEYKSLVDNWDWFTKTFFPVIRDKSEQERRLKISTDGYLEMWSLQDKDASRGRKYKRVIINEAAKVPHLEYSWTAVIRITLADLIGSAMFGSTPRSLNYFKTLYDIGADPLQPEWRSFHKTTYDNPYIPRSEIDSIKQGPELIYRQEVLAEFVNFEGSVFRRIQEAACLLPMEGPEAGRQYYGSVDVAASLDYTVVSVWDLQTKQQVAMDRYNRIDYNVLEDRLEAIYRRWHMDGMTIEINSIGQPVFDHLQGRGLSLQPFTTTSATKAAAIQALQSAFEHGEIKIVNDPVQVGELLSFEGHRTPSGSFTYSAPEGLHDDCVMSLAIGWWALDNSRVQVFL